jgi:hypothetical protein
VNRLFPCVPQCGLQVIRDYDDPEGVAADGGFQIRIGRATLDHVRQVGTRERTSAEILVFQMGHGRAAFFFRDDHDAPFHGLRSVTPRSAKSFSLRVTSVS